MVPRTDIIAASKNDNTEIDIIFIHPKNKPKAPMNFTSPNPIASFPAINPPNNVIIKNKTDEKYIERRAKQ